MAEAKKLYRDMQHKMIAGVCAGFAEYFGIDVSVVRLIAAILLVFSAGSIGAIYIISIIVIPEKPTA